MSRLATAPAPSGRTRMRGRIRHFEPPLRAVPKGSSYTEFVTQDGRRVFVHSDVLLDLAQLERAEHPNESAGLLFGRVFTDGVNQCALVRHLIRPEPGEVMGTPVTVTITAEGSNRMSQRAQERHPCADAVGWAHTHPTFSAYFSGTDRAEQAIWTAPASVGLVISGLPEANPRFEVFVGPESTLAQPAGRYDHLRHPRPTVAPRLRERVEAGSVDGQLIHSIPPPWGDSQPVPRRERRPGHGRPARDAVVRALPSIALVVLVVMLAWLVGSQLSAGGSGPAATRTAPSAPIDRIARENGGPSSGGVLPAGGGSLVGTVRSRELVGEAPALAAKLSQELAKLLKGLAASTAGSSE